MLRWGGGELYRYRLTSRGKAVISIFITIVFLLSSVKIMKSSVKAQDSMGYTVAAESKHQEATGFSYLNLENSSKTDYIKTNDSSAENEYKYTGNYFYDNEDTELHLQPSESSINGSETLRVNAEDAYATGNKKVAFLTFDDGPSKNITPQILEILSNYNIKATFFVLGSLVLKNSEILREVADYGHSIGIHTYSHDYSKIYDNIDNFLYEIMITNSALKRVLGDDFHTRLFRFPGGSFGGLKEPYIEAVIKEGYVYLDWNVITGDGESSGIAPSKLLETLKTTAKGKQHLIVLMHDSIDKETTVQALPGIIEYLKAQGYEFAALQ